MSIYTIKLEIASACRLQAVIRHFGQCLHVLYGRFTFDDQGTETYVSGCKIPIFKMLGRLRRLGDAQIQCFAQNLRSIVRLLTMQGHLLYPNLFSIQK